MQISVIALQLQDKGDVFSVDGWNLAGMIATVQSILDKQKQILEEIIF